MKTTRSMVLVMAAFAVIVSATIRVYGRPQDNVVARVGKSEIAVAAYARRLGDYLHSTSVKDNIVVRRQILDNMVHEDLIFAEARKQGWLESAGYQEKLQRVRTQAILDKYRERFISDSVTVNDEELKKAFARLNVRVSARHLYARTEEEAWELRNLLMKGVSFDTLAMNVFEDTKLRASGGYIGYFTYGEMDPAFEEAAYRLRVGEISEPVKTARGYSIIKVEDRILKPVVNEYEFVQRKKQLIAVLRALKVEEKVKAATEEIARTLSAHFDEAGVKTLWRTWSNLTSRDGIDDLQSETRHIGQRTGKGMLVEFSGGRWTIEDFLARVPLTTARQLRRAQTVDGVKRLVNGLLVRERLLHQALEKKVDRLPEVSRRLDTEMRVFVLERWRNLVTDTIKVPEELVRSWYEANKSSYCFPEQWDISEIAVPSREQALDLISGISNGASFELLARENSIRSDAAVTGGHRGLMTRQQLGRLADEVAAAKEGATLGPWSMDGYYSIVHVKHHLPSRQKSFKEASSEIDAELRLQLQQQAFLDALARLRKNSIVWTNDSLLMSIQPNNFDARGTL